MKSGNEKIALVHPSVIISHKKVTYGRLLVDIHPLKNEIYRVCLTVGGDKLELYGNAS